MILTEALRQFRTAWQQPVSNDDIRPASHELAKSAESLLAAAANFCHWYDEYQTDYARARIRQIEREQAGLEPEPFPDKSTMSCYEKMIFSYDVLHTLTTGAPRPNYVERANPRVHANSERV